MSSAKILDGKALAESQLAETANIIRKTGIAPGLAAILVGDNPASRLYVSLKEKAAEKAGIRFHKYLCNSECYDGLDEAELIELISFLNRDPDISAILVQVPLPEGFDQKRILSLIAPEKDADGFNGGQVVPPTVAAIIELVKSANQNLEGKRALVIGKSAVFIDGVISQMERQFNGLSISRAHAIPEDSSDYDLIIIALGQAGALKREQVKTGAIVIDVGISRVGGKTVGDVDPAVAEVARFMSPVPGGVGPLTVACLMRNTVGLALKK